MPGCSAVGCINRSEKGYIMKCFPRNPRLRKIWQERVARADWEPSNNSFLCHVHFEPQEWSITSNGKIRLKKNAVPSIFTITSTRRSAKKKIKLFDNKSQRVFQGECDAGCMIDGSVHSCVEDLEEKNLDFQGTVEPLVETEMEGSTHCKPNSGMATEDMKISNLVKECNLEVPPMDDKKEVDLTQEVKDTEAPKAAGSVVKDEIKLEVMDHNAFEDSYDEIEQKLKQICDGGSTEDETYKNKVKMKVDTKDQKKDEVEEKMDISSESVKNDLETAVSVDASHDLSIVGGVVDTIKVKEENVETIFGIESDEKTSVPSKALKTNENDEEREKDKKKVFNDDIEENFTKDEVHVIPNIRAAMKRKRRTREEIMKSIKKSIKSVADEDINSLSDNDSSEQDIEIGNGLFLINEKTDDTSKNDAETETAKFVIKVTGDPDDVTEIIEELSSCNTVRTEAGKKFNTVSMYKENDSFITSVITIQSPKSANDISFVEIDSPIKKDDYLISRKSTSPMDHSPCEKNDVTSPNAVNISRTRDSLDSKHIGSDEDEKHRMRIDSPFQSCTHGQISVENNSVNVPSDYEDLLERIQIQESVIEKLTDQLIIHKEMEMRNKLSEREMEASKVNTKLSNVQTTSLLGRRNLESKQRLIDDLSNRVSYLEEVNKKLMKTVTLESQQKRKLEGEIKQKENCIKELNWKLEKASKYLERAEKNTNTYRRKMLNMQTTLRRRKLLDEKMSRFNEMLIDNSKQEFSEKVLVTAADIRKVCGKDGYEKLLSYGFPLPPLTALKGETLNEDFTDLNNSDVDEVQNSTKLTVKTDKAYDATNEHEIDEKNREKGTEYEGAETVTGTVQDIFDENNEGDDFGTNELREHFILQLNAVM
ncbi:uncharacterized protein LOC108632307 isoform X2 [Ceratina calcarata]|nr:uncharacterized protein LOC108632307 isoform X2 [Ceratina calcarata]XP_017892285.1 uncharacterized protein LOC108632307 isoform X2 [Ceratina calcarata]XP_026675329.1 uncharacterized protein LOC108632307 isoform X2 [Ceratina calcarata]XP_026675330.1 uncharacterized protein LOC108632307 isoform X2 [Ceratina calcarata]